MTQGSLPGNQAYAKLIRMTLELHALMAQGKSESEEAEALRDDVYPAWGRISQQEAERINGLSADLYMLTGEEIHERADPLERTRQRLGPRLKTAWEKGDWDGVLALLRLGPNFLSQDQVAYLRGRCWAEMGHPEVAVLFFDHAVMLNPQNAGYQFPVLAALLQLGQIQDASRRAAGFVTVQDSQVRLLFDTPAPVAASA